MRKPIAAASNLTSLIIGFFVAAMALAGCSSMFQESHVALVREPGYRTYNDPPEEVAVSAR